MDDALYRAGWIAVAIFVVAYITFSWSDSMFNPKDATSTPMVVRDVLRKGQHHLYGKVVVPTACEEISMQALPVGENQYELAVTTWSEPAVICVNSPTEKVFDTVVFAPSVGVQFSASLNKVRVPLAVYPIVVY